MTARIATDPGTWGPSILTILADHHGVAGSRRTFRRLHGTAEGGLTLTSLIQAAEACGFETQAGRLPSYDDLKELSVLPAVVHLRRKVPERMLALRSDGAFEDVGREGRFAVVHRADEAEVDLEDPAEGRRPMPRSEFEDAWRGIVLCVAPGPDQKPRRDGSLRALAADRLSRVPLLLANVIGCGAALALGAGFADILSERISAAAAGTIVVALGASVGAIRTTARCAACAAAARKIGLPLAPLGVLYYAGLLVALGLSGLTPLTAAAILAAAGVHLALLADLAASRVHCLACSVVAAAAWTASGLALGGQGMGWYAAALPLAGTAAMITIRFLRRRIERLHRAQLGEIRKALTEEASPDPGSLRLIVYKRDTCPKCLLLEKDILPPLAAMLGERLTLERRAADLLPAPTLLFLGGEHRIAMIGLPDADDLREAFAGGF